MMILQTLRRHPLHGYALAQEIKSASGDELVIEEGSLYPALQRMLRAGWLKSEWATSSTNRRVRLYRITAVGRKHLEREVSSLDRMLAAVTRVLAPVRH
jgi:PadR family transcriptional regulator, regulatory protein PadR